MTGRLVRATHNRGKLAELRDILAGLDVTLLGADDVDLPDVDETGDTFEATAALKARAGVAATGLACVADDSGLEVDHLDGAPGIYSARFAGLHGGPERDDDANLRLVLARLQGVPDTARTARFVCVAVLALPDGTTVTERGVLEGRITTAARGSNGFGYDPIFEPLGSSRTTAELPADEKHAISHRGRAFRALRGAIAEHLST